LATKEAKGIDYALHIPYGNIEQTVFVRSAPEAKLQENATNFCISATPVIGLNEFVAANGHRRAHTFDPKQTVKRVAMRPHFSA
jgi:hypothetical protein